MPRLNRAWFEFKGINSALYGIKIMDADVFYMPVERVTSYTAAGRSGVIQRSEHAFDAFDIQRKIRVPMSQLNDVAAWLSGSGKLRFSYAPTYAYEARVNALNRNGKPLEFKRVSLGEDPMFEGSVIFSCQPYRYLYPAAPSVEITESGAILRNPGNTYSQPRVTIYGRGEFKITIGEQVMEFGNVVDGIVVDTELGDALTLDGKSLANNWIMDSELWEIEPGENVVTWEVYNEEPEEEEETETTGDGETASGTETTGENDGSGDETTEEETEPANAITKVVVEPRWRYQ